MADLREATRQTVHLAVLDGTEVVYVEILRSAGGPWLPSEVGAGYRRMRRGWAQGAHRTAAAGPIARSGQLTVAQATRLPSMSAPTIAARGRGATQSRPPITSKVSMFENRPVSWSLTPYWSL